MAKVKCEIAERPRDGSVFDCMIPCKDCGEPFRWSEKRAHVGAFPLICSCRKVYFPTEKRIDPTADSSYPECMEVKWHKSPNQ